jgi:uncharacterized membrane protein
MTKGRLVAFSDGVMAIIITIMGLELKTPPGADWADLGKSLGSLFAYALSFTFIAIYWNNHHHMLHTCAKVTGGVLWANTHLLFWLSLVPFATTWLEHQVFTPAPTAAYGILLFFCAVAYTILQATIIRANGPQSKLKRAVGADWKGRLSASGYLLSIPIAMVAPAVSVGIFVIVALVWLIPDRRIEKTLNEST